MASKSSIGAVHFTLMFFVITTLGFGVAWYMTYGEYVDAAKTEADAKKALADKETQARQYFDEIDKLKKLIGHEMNEIGDPGAANPDQTTVIGNIEADLRNVGGPDMGSTYAAVVRALRKRIDDLEVELVQANDNIKRLQTEMLASLDDKYTQPVAVAKADTQRAIQARNTATTDFDEKIKANQALVTRYAAEVNDLRVQNDQLQETFEEQRRDLLRELNLLRQINSKIAAELEERNSPSFERADGTIVKVDHTTGLVWIDLGSGDDLPPRTSFSVYTKTHHGVGRGEQDIKGAIEVTRIIDDHLAEARILEEDYSSPITNGDPIYTPIWSPGRKHRFAVVGEIDFDENDISDRNQFREIVRAAGGVIDVEVDDEGRVSGNGLTVYHKFLVVGIIPDQALEIDPEEIEKARRISEAHKDLINQARLQGVRVVSLDLFLEWAGYRPQRRLFRPGEGGFNLKGGATATAVGGSPYDFEAAGQTSKLFEQGRRYRKQKTSSGTTAKVFGGR